MLIKTSSVQNKIVVTTLEALMPQEHFLRDLAKVVDFSFIYEKVEHLYSQFGRPAIDPVQLIKMLLLGFLYGIDSERRIEREIQVNIAYRWFLGLDLDSQVPDHSTISQTRRRKFHNSNIFEEIFAEIVKKCIETGLVDGSLILTDSTHVKANAGFSRSEPVIVKVEPSEYLKKLDLLCEEEDYKVRAEAIANGMKKKGYRADTATKTKTVTKSITDPDSGMLNRATKPKGFHYLSHQSVDGKIGIITDVHVTPANVNDYEPYVSRIKYQKEKLGLPIQEVGLDKGYDQIEVHKEMLDLGIRTYTPLIDTSNKASDVFPVTDFEYNPTKDVYVCPNKQELKFVSVNKSYRRKVYAQSQKICKNCLLKNKCFSSTGKFRTLLISPHQREADIQRSTYGSVRYRQVQRLRKIYCEGNFGLQKDNHNLRRTRKRGNKNVTEHCILSALALNLKRMVKHLKTA